PPGQGRHPRGLAPDQPVVVTVEEPHQAQTGRFRPLDDLVAQRRIVLQPDVAVPSHSSPFEEAHRDDAQTSPSAPELILFLWHRFLHRNFTWAAQDLYLCSLSSPPVKRIAVLAVARSLVAAACTTPSATPPPAQPAAGSPTASATPAPTAAQAAGKISHVVIIMQENRSFDSYFGTYPGADGLPRDARGIPTVCSPDPKMGTCVKPYHDGHDLNLGGPHGVRNSIRDINGGKMTGFIAEAAK